ncbi:MAG TPA: hypothetical protein VKR21_07410 [Solirubrobacteraceae bacterium]|nr:hypothetical protein [Solirubrobacteraceae bacterium]
MADTRPDDNLYYETRLALFSQGDIFRDVPLAYPTPADEFVLADDEDTAGSRRFLSGPFDVGFAMLVTPTCSRRAQGGHGYAHPVRTLLPLRPFDELVEVELLDSSKAGLLRKRDALINYMYLPSNDELELPESIALLYMPVTLHHDFLAGQRVTQLTVDAARQLHSKLVWFASGLKLDRETFDPPMD